jgi:hypothetical protein
VNRHHHYVFAALEAQFFQDHAQHEVRGITQTGNADLSSFEIFGTFDIGPCHQGKHRNVDGVGNDRKFGAAQR